MTTTCNQGSLSSPNDEDSRCGVLEERDKDLTLSHTSSFMSYNLVVNGKDDQTKNTMCARGVCEKESCLCLNRKYSDHIRNALNKKGNKKFVLAREEFKKSMSNFPGVMYR